jgi:hypothetical protein
MKPFFLFLAAVSLSAPLAARGANFDLSVGYAQSADFWKVVQQIQDQTGNLGPILKLVNDQYGQPDVGFTYLEAGYSYPQEWLPSEALSHAWITTKAEALAGGEISNPILPIVQAYANTTGIVSYGLRSAPEAKAAGHCLWGIRVLGGLGPEKRLYAQGPEFLDTIPVRSGTLALAGAEVSFLDQSELGGDFWITTNALVRPVYFHSSVDPSPDLPDEPTSFMTWHWQLENEWLKEVPTSLSPHTRIGIITTLGQTPIPFTSVPITWDYQQKTQLFPGLGAISGIGGILRIVSENSSLGLATYLGEFGGGFGGGVNAQLGPILLNGSSYTLENDLTTSHDKTRLYQVTAGVSL